jgi:prefoldin subunit 5
MKKVFPYIVLLAALCLASSAAYYSVFGLSKLFSAQSLAVIIMAGTLEVSKLIAAVYLHRYWKKLNFLIKTYLTTAVITLMFITSVGIYGFLVSAYQTTADQLTIIDKQIEVIDLKKERFQEQLTGYSTEKTQLAESITELSKGLSNNVIQYKDRETGQIITTTSSSTRKVLKEQLNDFKDQRNIVSIKIESLADSITKLDLQVLDIESTSEAAVEVGPLKYVSKLLDKPMDIVVNWFILIFIFVFDPFAIILLISANKAFMISREDNNIKCIAPDGYELNKEYPLEEFITDEEEEKDWDEEEYEFKEVEFDELDNEESEKTTIGDLKALEDLKKKMDNKKNKPHRKNPTKIV